MSDVTPRWVRLDTSVVSTYVRKFYEFFQNRIVGQQRALSYLARIYELHCARMNNPQKPICSVLLAGATGVGKTESVKAFAEFLFGDRNALTIVNCGTFEHGHEISILTGSPPGYVGSDYDPILSQKNIEQPAKDAWRKKREAKKKDYEENDKKYAWLEKERKKLINQRTKLKERKFESQSDIDNLAKRIEQIDQQIIGIDKQMADLWIHTSRYIPNEVDSIILFDEVEKAARSVQKTLLTILNDGRLTLNNGQVTDFTRSYIFFTSNIGSEEIVRIQQGRVNLGFHQAGESLNTINQAIDEAVRDKIYKEFLPEFVGRLNYIVVYQPLSRADIAAILDLEIKHLQSFMADLYDESHPHGFPIYLEVTSEVKEFIVNRALKYRELGVRRLQDEVQDVLKVPLATLKNSFRIKAHDVIRVRLIEENGEKKIIFEKLDEGNQSIIAVQGYQH